MASEEIKLNAKADSLTLPDLYPEKRSPLLGGQQNLSFDDTQMRFASESYQYGAPAARALAEARVGTLQDPTQQKNEPTIFASDQKSGGATISLGGAKKKDDEKKEEGNSTGTPSATQNSGQQKPSFAETMLADAMQLDIPIEIIQLQLPTSPQGVAKSTTPGKGNADFFAQFNKKPTSIG